MMYVGSNGASLDAIEFQRVVLTPLGVECL